MQVWASMAWSEADQARDPYVPPIFSGDLLWRGQALTTPVEPPPLLPRGRLTRGAFPRIRTDMFSWFRTDDINSDRSHSNSFIFISRTEFYDKTVTEQTDLLGNYLLQSFQ